MSWQAARAQGRAEFENGDYEAALSSFRDALCQLSSSNSNNTQNHALLERQLLLSNAVACRLKLGGAAQARAAIADAQACIALNPAWSKGHVRLASAYIALTDSSSSSNGVGGEQHSNDACNALQTALRHDPNNRVARQMLVQELRRDHRHRSATTTTGAAAAVRNSSSRIISGSLDQQDEEGEREDAGLRDPPVNPNYVPPLSTTTPTNEEPILGRGNSNGARSARATDQVPPVRTMPNPINLEDDDDALSASVTLKDRLQFYAQRAHNWYASLSDDARAALQTVAVLLVLYVAFGGRFGYEGIHSSSSSKSGGSQKGVKSKRGNYGEDNVYEQTRRQRQQEQQRQQETTYQSRNSNDKYDSYGGGGGGSSYTNNSSYNNSSSSDLSGLVYIAIMLAAIYVGHLFGISPWQVMMAMRIVNGRGGGGFGGGGGMYGRYRHRGGGGFGRRRW